MKSGQDPSRPPAPTGGSGRTPGRQKKIATALAVATCSLLGMHHGPSAADAEPGDTLVDAGVLFFNERSRVQDLSGTALIRHFLAMDRSVTLRFVYDALTGASANGAVPASRPQTFTSASGAKGYTTPSGETPLDTTFHDQRLAVDGTWNQPLGLTSHGSFGATFSTETDYLSTGLNARLSRDFFHHNTTLSGGLSFSRDTVTPLNGVPVPFAVMTSVGSGNENERRNLSVSGLEAATVPPPSGHSSAGSSRTKNVADLLFGVTQVFGPRTVAMFNYSWDRSTGYLTDPYKILSVVDPVTGDPIPDPNGVMNIYLYESRPDTRTKKGFYAEIRHHFSRDMFGASYRYMTDDWGIRSDTYEVNYRFDLGRWYLEPSLRWYTQTAASFYRRVLFVGEKIPRYASADYRLGALDAYTVGMKYGRPLDEGREWNVRLEYYNQSGASPPEASVGSLRKFDLFPTVDSLILEFGVGF